MSRVFQYDVAVVGDGPAGVAAAVGAHDCGCRTLLIERNGYLGGECAASNVPAYCGFFDRMPEANPVVEGVGARLLYELRQLGIYQEPKKTPGKNWCVPVEPESVKYAMDRLTTGGPDLFLHTVLIGVKKSGNRIHSLICADDEGTFLIECGACVDATGDGNLAHLAQASVQFGDGKGQSQVSSMVMYLEGIDPDAVYSAEIFHEAIRKAKMCGIGPFGRERGTVLRWLNPGAGFASFAAVTLPSLDAESWTKAEQEGRRQAWAYIEAFRRFVPGMEKVRLVNTGNVLGVRETRKLIGAETLTGADVLKAKKCRNSIGRGCWPVEMHEDIRKPAVFRYLPEEDSYYCIPLGILKSRNIENLWAGGRIVSADPEAFASVRVGGTAFVTGHAAGIAAAESLNGEKNLTERVQNSLRNQGALL